MLVLFRKLKLNKIYPGRLLHGKGRFILNISILFICLFLLGHILYQFKYVFKFKNNFFRQDDDFIHTEEVETFVNKNINRHKKDVLGGIQEKMTNLPVLFWNKTESKSMKINNTCGRFPSILELEYNNLYWQTLVTTNGTFQLLGAYLDNRSKNLLGPAVRILGMLNRIKPNVSTYCHFWFEGEKRPIVEKSYEYKYLWYKEWGNYKQGIYQPYLITCVIPAGFKDKIPQAISLVENPCDNSTTNLRVIYNKPEKKKDFAVCVKGLAFLDDDFSERLVEWIELMSLLGADKIFFYDLHSHTNIKKILKYYEEKGQVHVTPLTLAGNQPNEPHLQHLYLKEKVVMKRINEIIPYNDCFYKHMYEYKFIIVKDIDEVIMPLEGTWIDLMNKVLPKARKIGKEDRSSYNVRNVYFLDTFHHDHEWAKDIPKYMHMLQHIYRAKNFTKPGYFVKSFHNTERVLALHNHFPLHCIGGECSDYSIETQDAQLQHYRSDCVSELSKTCKELKKETVKDITIWKFKEPHINRVKNTLSILGLLSQSKDVNIFSNSYNCQCKFKFPFD